jgi:hypothetical protein
MTILVTAVVSAVVSAAVAFLYERITADRRLSEALARAEIVHDREIVLSLGRALLSVKEDYHASDQSVVAQEAFASSLGMKFRPLLNEVSNRMIRKMMMLEGDVWTSANAIAYEWTDFGRSWGGEEPWFSMFSHDVDIAREGIEVLIGGDSDWMPPRRYV